MQVVRQDTRNAGEQVLLQGRRAGNPVSLTHEKSYGLVESVALPTYVAEDDSVVLSAIDQSRVDDLEAQGITDLRVQ